MRLEHPLRKPTRIPGFDYATAGTYFITICLNDRFVMRFGDAGSGELVLNDAGVMIGWLWLENIDRYPGTSPDHLIVMPNHIHAILHLGTDPKTKPARLTDIVATFKSISTLEYGRFVRDKAFPPYETMLWQRSFHDRILGSHPALEAARAYIEGNPARWIEKQRVSM